MQPHPEAGPVDQRLMSVPIANVHPDPDNPRVELGDLDELAASLEQVGMLQPIIARRAGERLVVVAGHRRLAAARLAGWDKVPVIVRPPMRSDDVLVAMLVENGHRRDLDPVEEARALARLMKLDGIRTHAELSRRVGRHQTYVSARLALLALSPAEQAELSTGQIKIVEATERARLSAGRVRSRRDPSVLWFGASHDLATRAKARCTRMAHKRGNTLPGGVACPSCWESVIRADERQHLNEHAAAYGQFPAEPVEAPDVFDEPEVDEVAVRRAADGDAVRLTRAEKHAAVELLHRRGLHDRAIAERLHVTDRTALRLRQRLGLPAVAP